MTRASKATSAPAFVIPAVQAYAERLGRPLTALETAAVEEGTRITERKEAQFAAWLDRMSDWERRVLGMKKRETV